MHDHEDTLGLFVRCPSFIKSSAHTKKCLGKLLTIVNPANEKRP
jgi:hypothetical protein